VTRLFDPERQGAVMLRRWLRAHTTGNTLIVSQSDITKLGKYPEDLEAYDNFIFSYVGDSYFDHAKQEGIFTIRTPVVLRPSWDEMGMALADTWARRSVDEKVRVGCVILSDSSHYAVGQGYNGRYPGCPNEGRASPEQGQSQAIHAELNAVMRARWEPGETHTLYCTHAPCPDCAVMILGARKIGRVVFRTPYEMKGRVSGTEILQQAGLGVDRWWPDPE
jgi:dCMP deaminase